MITLYYLEMPGHVHHIQDVPFDGGRVFQFNPTELMKWAAIWTRQSGEEVRIQVGNVQHITKMVTCNAA